MTFALVLVLGITAYGPDLVGPWSQQRVAEAGVLAASTAAKAETPARLDVAPANVNAAPTAIVAIRPTSAAKPAVTGRGAWLALSIAQHGAATFDAWTTRRKLQSGGYRENNPLLRPFASNDSLYAVVQVTPMALNFVGNRMRHSERRWLRRVWWLPQTVQTAAHFTCGFMNLAK